MKGKVPLLAEEKEGLSNRGSQEEASPRKEVELAVV